MSNQEPHLLSFDLLIRHTTFVSLPFSVLLIALTVGHVFLPAGLSIARAADNSVHGQKHTPSPNDEGFTDVTKESGVAALLMQHYDKNPKWWLSGLHLVDLDGDGKLDLFLGAHGGGEALAALNDGSGHFSPAPGSYPSSEIHLAYDADENGKVDLTMTFQDGGGKWWLNRGQAGRLAFEGTKIERGTNTARRQAMIDLDRDGKVDWLRGTPGRIILERGDGNGGFTNSHEIPVGDSQRTEVLCLPIDIDGDGFIDLLAEWGHYGSPASNSRIFRNDGKMNFTDVTKDCGLALTGMSIKGAGDVNSDGFTDLFVVEDKVPQVYLNDGQGNFTKKAGALRHGAGHSAGVCLVGTGGGRRYRQRWHGRHSMERSPLPLGFARHGRRALRIHEQGLGHQGHVVRRRG